MMMVVMTLYVIFMMAIIQTKVLLNVRDTGVNTRNMHVVYKYQAHAVYLVFRPTMPCISPSYKS